MRYAKLTARFNTSRWLALLLIAPLVLQFSGIKTHAEETVVVHTDWHPTEAHPIYVIAAPPQEKMPLRPLNIPIVPARQTPAKTSSPNELQLPFQMSAAQAVRIGSGLIKDADYQLALLYFEDARKQDPNSIDVVTGLARCYYELGRDGEALALYKEAIAQNPSVWESQYYLGRIHLENGRYAEAVEALGNAIKLKPDDPDTISGLGVALNKSGKSTEAITYLTRVTSLKRYIKEDYYYLGEAYANEQQWMKAAQEFKEGADLRGLDPNGYFYWATMLFNADKLDEALEGYQKVRSVDLSVSQVETFRYMAEIYRLHGMAEKALGQYQSLLQREPNDVEALFHAGYISFRLNQLDQAQELFRRLIQIDPKHAGGAANFAALEARYNEIHSSRHEKMPGITLREVVQANSNSVEAHTNLGAQLITEAAFPEAMTILERAVSLRPNSAAGQYNLGLAQVKVGKYEAAVESNKKALELKADWPDAYNNLGLAYAGLGRWEEAANAYREAVRIVQNYQGAPNYQGALYNLGIASLRLGQKTVTLQIYDKLRQMNWDLQARLWQEILATERATNSVAIPMPSPTPLPTQVATEASPPVADNRTANKPTSTPTSSADEECPGPFYKPSGVTQMALIKEPLQVSYTAEAAQNKVEGRIVLKMTLCSNGRVSDISIEEPLPFGLTERVVEAVRKVRFEPALLDSRPVSILVTQTFVCAQQVCTAISP
jgi:TonB family protein